MAKKCPCYGCPDRSADPNCHSELCQHGWLEWREQEDAAKAKRDMLQRAKNTADGYHIAVTRKLKRR